MRRAKPGALSLFLMMTATAFAQQTDPNTTRIERGTRDAQITAQATTNPQTPPPRRTVQPVTPVDQERRSTTPQRTARELDQAYGEPDVLLDVPNISVEEITLEVENLRAHLSLDARVANLVSLTAGADVAIDKVKLTIKGVQAEAHLVVRLDNVAAILDRTLTTIDRNPEILVKLLETVDKTVGTVGEIGQTALQPGGVVSQTVGTVGRTLENVTAPGGLLTQTVNTLGQTVQRTVDTTGRIVEKTLDTTGKVVNERTLGNVLRLDALNQTTNAAGQIVKQVRDASGAIIEVTLDKAGKVVNTRVISQATGTRQ